MRVSWRPYATGDETAINQLYREVTGRQRTAMEWAWQWQQAPAGPGRVFLIEAEEDGEKRLIGHHGIMPVRFVWRGEPLVFGKTENTMVLPSYRNRILYPRFEHRFQAAYEPDLDALFSTTGPDAAIRLRQALGYQFAHEWINLTLFAGARAGWEFVRQKARWGCEHGSAFAALKSLGVGSFASGGSELRLYSGGADVDVTPLETFASQCASRLVEPSRRVGDLAWRYWNNPHTVAITFLVDHSVRGRALVTVTHRPELAAAVIDDVVTETGNANELIGALDAVISFVRDRTGISIYQFSTTSDYGIERLAALKARSRAGWGLIVSRFRKEGSRKMMPRKVTGRGKAKGLTTADWGISPIVFQGI